MIKFTESQKQYIVERISLAKETAKGLMITYKNGDSRKAYSFYLLGALESILAGFCDKSASELFDI